MQFEPTGGFPPIMILNEIPSNTNLNKKGFSNPIASISNIMNSSDYSNFLNFDNENKGGDVIELATSDN